MFSDEKVKQKTLLLIGKRIKTIRIAKGITATAIAGQCNFESSNYFRIERGDSNPTALTLLKICKALDITLEELFKGFDPVAGE